ncbi:PEPxxWA-CTERM sorting domain-containing protein [Novosphingobium sp. Gsoil 351]|uniref:PEPxxWA-CTERM sorting domain-containing protein n=1 Tax=Novosphingobium sp. Gsoil 351 TaxID=2675225 RepID=UPI0012B4741D|nr:PEPxxWA-CTERM sorting domain-containing protein [Novosphingobium sp. Gsoil 351]QGN54632.1 PEPxxWA-CTERM sorting domain-containing protein [Novosphingobium sp. Gsoil 351]
MRKAAILITTCLAFAAPASAATLLSASVTGPTGTVWDTVGGNSFYNVFLQRNGLSNPVINPTDSSLTPTSANSGDEFLIYGDGYPVGTFPPSDAIYTLTLGFEGGAALLATYASGQPNAFLSTNSALIDGLTYSISDFSWNRTRANPVSEFSAVPGGDLNDYNGNFRLSAVTAAVPEPATWAMMLAGFGILGGALRRRKATVAGVRVRYV